MVNDGIVVPPATEAFVQIQREQVLIIWIIKKAVENSRVNTAMTESFFPVFMIIYPLRVQNCIRELFNCNI